MKKINYYILFSIVITLSLPVSCMKKLVTTEDESSLSKVFNTKTFELFTSNFEQKHSKPKTTIPTDIILNKIIPYLSEEDYKEIPTNKNLSTALVYERNLQDKSPNNFNTELMNKALCPLTSNLNVINTAYSGSSYKFTSQAITLLKYLKRHPSPNLENYLKRKFTTQNNLLDKMTYLISDKQSKKLAIKIEKKQSLTEEEQKSLAQKLGWGDNDGSWNHNCIRSGIKMGKFALLSVDKPCIKDMDSYRSIKLEVVDTSTNKILFSTPKFTPNILNNTNTICPISDNEFIYLYEKKLLLISILGEKVTSQTIINNFYKNNSIISKDKSGNLVTIALSHEPISKRPNVIQNIIPLQSLQNLCLKDLIRCNYLFDKPNIDLSLPENKPFKDILDNNEIIKLAFEKKLEEYNKYSCIQM